MSQSHTSFAIIGGVHDDVFNEVTSALLHDDEVSATPLQVAVLGLFERPRGVQAVISLPLCIDHIMVSDPAGKRLAFSGTVGGDHNIFGRSTNGCAFLGVYDMQRSQGRLDIQLKPKKR